jgi:sensor histidine kinase YesM
MILRFGTAENPQWQQRTRQFIVKNKGILLLLLSLGLLFLLTDIDNFVSDFSRGFYDGYTDKDCNCDAKSLNSNSHLFIAAIVSLIFLSIACVLIVQIASLFYNFLFRFILQKTQATYIISFIIWLLIIHSLTWMGLNQIFIKTNFLDESLTKTIKDRREDAAVFLSFLFLIVMIAYGLVKNYINSSKIQAKLMTQKANAEIQALKAQINPHFLFNTLNNLYGTAIVEESPKTADGIQQLARIMRHAVEGSKNEHIEIEKEINFLRDYIEIQQLRIPKRDNIKINTSITWDEIDAQITPLILMTFAENAFKYGISINHESFIDIKLSVEQQQLTFICRNSIVPRTQIEVGTGTGVENTLKRLALLYPNRHTININQTDTIYEVFLTINLSK